MSGIRLFGLGAVLPATLIFASTAFATPVPWNYSAAAPGLVPVAETTDAGIRILTQPGSGQDDQNDNILATFWGDYDLSPNNPLFGQSFVIDPLNNQFTLELTLRDELSGEEGTHAFSWEGSGTVGPDNAAGVSLDPVGEASWSPVLGGRTYNVTLRSQGPEVPAPGSLLEGQILMDVSVVSPPPATEEAPEPATLILAGLGVGLLGVRSVRRAVSRR